MATSKKQTGAMSKDREDKYVAAMDKQLKSRGTNTTKSVPMSKRTKSYTTIPAKKKK